MNAQRTVHDVVVFAASVAGACTASLAIAAAAAVGVADPRLRDVVPVDLVRLDPVLVTMSRSAFDAIRADEAASARTAGAGGAANG